MSEESTTSTAELSSDAGSVNALDQISELLLGSEPTPAKKPKPDESEEADTQPDDSTQDEGADAEEEETEEAYDAESDEEITWAKTLGVDEKNVVLDEDGNLAGINVKVDGKVSTVGVKDLIAGYQSNKSNTNKSKLLADERREFDEVKYAVVGEYTKKIETVNALTEHMKKNLLGEYANVDWNKLRYENPGEYAAAVQDFNFRNQEIETIMNAVGVERGQIGNQLTAEQQQLNQEYIKAQADRVLEKNPSWANPDVFKKALGSMTDFVASAYGFSQEEFANIQDARMLEVVKDAMAYRSSKESAKTKMAVKVPSYQKSTGKTTKQVSKLQQLTQKAQSAKGYSKRAAETDAVAMLLGGGI